MPIVGSFVSSCNETQVDLDAFVPSFFDDNQYAFIRKIVDALLPESDTPGALSVGVPEMFDIMVDNVLTEEKQAAFTAQLSKLMKYVNSQLKARNVQEISDIIHDLDASLRYDSEADRDVVNAYEEVRSRALQYYVGSESVGTTLLNYLPVPGAYVPCMELDQVGGKSWAI